MPVNLSAPDPSQLFAVAGVDLSVAEAGIKTANRKDVVLIELAEGSTVAGVFTQNRFCAAPVFVAKNHLAQGAPRALIINTGNANAGTGEDGRDRALAVCAAVAKLKNCPPESVLPFSTGVILEPLPHEKIIASLPNLRACDWAEAAAAIMTTDIVPKAASRRVEIGGKTVTLSGMAKGSGMICPDMATMLAYVATDAKIEQAFLNQMLIKAANASFNRITVDGDTSTNDAMMLIVSGASGVEITENSPAAEVFFAALVDLSQELAKAIVRDGEGATKLMTIEVCEGRDEAECAQMAYAIAHSPLVKTAFFASDPNLGRLVMAIGRAGVMDLDVSALSVYLGDVCVVENGGRAASYTEEAGQRVMNDAEITIRVNLARGTAQTTVWTCDFSYDYVRINAEYRS